MGNQESDPNGISPLVQKLKICLSLTDNQGQHRTRSMIHQEFSVQIDRKQGSKISRSMSPFCPLDIQDDSNWITTCFVSPIMLIASPLYLCDKDGRLQKKCKVMPVDKQSILSIPIQDVIVIEKNDICLLTLERPFWRVGWAGFSYISSIQELRAENLKIFNHPERISSNNEQAQMVHVQVARRFNLPSKPIQTNALAVQSHGITGSLICKIVNKKPYIVGMQASDHEVIFFGEKDFKLMGDAGRKYLKEKGREQEILKQIDLSEFEEETKW